MHSRTPRRSNSLARRKFFTNNPMRFFLSALASLCLLAGFYFAPALLSRQQTSSGLNAVALPISSGPAAEHSAISQTLPDGGIEAPAGTLAQTRVKDAYGRLPIAFEENDGQHDRKVKYSTRGSGFQIFLTSDEAVLALNRPSTKERQEHDPQVDQEGAARSIAVESGALLRMQLVGANRRARVKGEDELAAKSNYFIGAGSKSWHTGVAMFEKVRFTEVYPGVDVVYYGNQRQLEYDFILAPHVDPARIKFKFSGANGINLDAEGHLLLETDGGHVRQEKPTLYQLMNGRRHEVAGRYAIKDGGEVGFEVGEYDRRLPLVIDPVLSYSTYLGGTGTDQALAVALDQQGNAYLTGQTASTDFATASPLQGVKDGFNDAFVLKINPSGTALVYATYLGGNGSDIGTGIAVDTAGNAYVTGLTGSGSFPRTFGTLQESKGGGIDGFVTKLSAGGDVLVYSSFLGGENFDQGYAIAVNAAGNAYVTGRADSTTFLRGIPMGKQGSSAYRSSDAAATWSAINNGLTDANAAFIRIDPTNANTLYAAGASGVFKSTDRGNFWRLTGQIRTSTSPLSSTSVAVDPSTPTTIYASTSSTGVYKSTNGGDLWDTSRVGLDSAASIVNHVVIDPSNSSTLYAATANSVYKSVNAGASWTRSAAGIPSVSNQTSKIIFDPADSNILYAATARGVYKSVNSAASWTDASSGLGSTSGAPPAVAFLATSPANAATIYAGTSNGVYKSTNSGQNWVLASDGIRVQIPTPDTLFIPPITSIAISAAAPETIYASSPQGGVFKSTDGGANWSATNNGLANFFVTSLAVDNTNASNLYATTNSGPDAFVIKLNTSGSHFDYLRYVGGNEPDVARGIAVDSDGNAYLTGVTNSTNFPTLNPAQASGGVVSDAFITKLGLDGSVLYSTYLGGSGGEQGFGIAVNAAGNAYVTGSTASANFPTAGPRQTTNTLGTEVFVSRLSVSGSSLDYSVYHGGRATEQGSAIALDASGNAYVTGVTSSLDFPVLNAVQQVSGGGSDAFVLKLNPTGQVMYSTYLGGGGLDQGFGIAADASGAAYVVGSTSANNFPTASPLQSTYKGGEDAFIARLAPSVDLSVTMSDSPDPVVSGDDLTYTINVANVGELTATGVRLTDTLPSGSVLVSASTNTGTCSGTATVTCDLGSLAGGASATVTIVIKPPATRSLSNTASVTANEAEVNTANNTATQATLVNFADLSMTTGVLQSFVTKGGRLTFVLAVSNNGGVAASNVNISLSLPTGLTLVSCTPSAGTSCASAGNNLTITVPTLAVNASQSVIIVGDVAGDIADNAALGITATASSSLPDPDPTNNSAAASATVSANVIQPQRNGQIAFASDGIYVMNDDGTNIRKIYSETQGRFSLPTWSPDGTKIAFMNEDLSGSGIVYEVRVVNADGSAPRVLSTDGTLDSRPTWSPSGAFVGFVSRGRQSIQVVNAIQVANPAGLPAVTTLFTLPASKSLSEVAWSPDGTKLLYNVGFNELWTANVDGSNQQLLDNDPNTIDMMPAWSPDGTKIVFLRRLGIGQSDDRSIYTMNADGTNAQPLPNPVHGTSSLKRPVFSPDGTMIAYESIVSINGSGFLAPGILKVNADGTNITRVPADGQGGSAPSWQGLPASGPPPTPVPTFKISGHVAPPSGTSFFLQGHVRLDLTGSRTASAYPDDNGNYSFTLPAGGNYTITPAVNPFYNFNPGSYTFDNLSADQSNANFTTTRITYSVSGRVTDTNGAPLGDVEITLMREGFLQGTRRTGADGTYAFNDLSYGRTHTVYVSTSSRTNYEFAPDARTFGLTQSEVVNFVGTPKNSFQFSTDPYLVNEGNGRVTVSITRAGIPSMLAAPASVTVQTFDDPAAVPCDPTIKRPDGTAYPQGTAYARCDYATTVETLQFAPGELQKSVSIPIIDDAHVEVTETVSVHLSNALGATLGRLNSVNVVIHDNDTAAAENPTRTTSFFVRQHYLDFLSREPEAGEPWSGVLERCPNAFNLDPQSLSASCDRLIVSQSFFGSPEFRLKGFYVFNFYRLAYNRRPTYEEIIPDMRSVSGATADEVYVKRAAFPNNFTNRAEFKVLYDGLGDTAFVDTLLSRHGLQQITTSDPANPEAGTKVVLTRGELLTRLVSNGPQMLTRAQVLRALVESDEVGRAEYNKAFVAMQYYGYLRRTPEEDGYQAWLRVINEDPNNIRIMVNGFMNSTEYRLRFGQP